VCRHLEIAESTWHRWLAQFSGMKANDAKRLTELEAENARLKMLVANGPRYRHAAGDLGGKLLTPNRKRSVVGMLRDRFGVSERRACVVVGQHRSTQRLDPPPISDDEAQLREFLRAFSKRRPRWGWRRAAMAARKAGWAVNDKRNPAVKAARSAMDERNQLLHSLWPREDAGWRDRPSGTVPTEYVGLPALRDVIGRLVEAVDGLGHFLYSPIEPTSLAPMRRRKNVPMHEAVDAHDLRSNKDCGPLREEFRIDVWSKAIIKTARLRTISGDFTSQASSGRSAGNV